MPQGHFPAEHGCDEGQRWGRGWHLLSPSLQAGWHLYTGPFVLPVRSCGRRVNSTAVGARLPEICQVRGFPLSLLVPAAATPVAFFA